MIEKFDWAATALGPISGWPEPLLGAVRLVLASPVSMCLLCGKEGVLIYNDAYAPLAGQRHPSSLGASIYESWPELVDFHKHVLDQVFSGGTVTYARQPLVFHRNGVAEDVWMDVDYSPIFAADGQVIAALAVVFEVTSQVVAERALELSDERLSFAVEAAGVIGSWDWDVAADRVVADRRFAEMYGVDPNQAALGLPIQHFIDGVHPADRAMVAAKVNDALRERGIYRVEYRLGSAEGPERWVLAVGRALADSTGRAARFSGIVVDITREKEADAALAQSELRFRVLADTMPQMVWSTRPDGFHDYYNARWYEFTGVPPGSTDGEEWNGMFHPEDQARAWKVWRHSLATGDPYQIEYRLRHRSGQYRWTLGLALPVRDENGEIVRWFGTCTDIHEQKNAAEEREIVAQELSHRIKNIFSVLNGIIGLSARNHPESRAFAAGLRQRIQAMGEAHDFVRPHSSASRPDHPSSLRALIRKLLTPHQGSGDERLEFSGPDARIDDGAATPLALLIHELATNAAKYGALASTGGRIKVDTRIVDETYHLVWKETGGAPLAGAPETEGFGSRLIALSAEGQLGGKLTRRWEPDGLVLELVVPLDSLSRSTTLRPGAS